MNKTALRWPLGPLWGALWNLTGATVGAALAFLIARYLGADWVARRACNASTTAWRPKHGQRIADRSDRPPDR